MDKIELIRQEIERLKEEGRINRYSAMLDNDGWSFSAWDQQEAVMTNLLSFINSLDEPSHIGEEETVSASYDPDYLQSHIDKAKESWEGVDVDEFMDEVRGREKSEIPTNLEEAALEYETDNTIQTYDGNGLSPMAVVGLAEAFIAGAEWQKEQDFKDFLKSDNTNFYKCYEKGREDQKREDQETIELAEDHAMMAGRMQMKEEIERDNYLYPKSEYELGWLDELKKDLFEEGRKAMKEEMMKEAVEGVLVDNIDGTQEICLHDNRYGKKVKLIAIPKDDD